MSDFCLTFLISIFVDGLMKISRNVRGRETIGTWKSGSARQHTNAWNMTCTAKFE